MDKIEENINYGLNKHGKKQNHVPGLVNMILGFHGDKDPSVLCDTLNMYRRENI